MNKRGADDASPRGFLARRTRRVSAFPRRIYIQYQFTPRESCPLPTQRPRTLHIDTCVNQRVVTRRGKCEKRNKRGRCACPTDLLICFLNLLPPPLIRSFLFEKSIDEVEPVVVVEPVVAERDVAGRHRKYAPCPLRECGRGWAVNLALFILIYTTSVLSSPWIRLPRVVCGLFNARICRFPSEVCTF